MPLKTIDDIRYILALQQKPMASNIEVAETLSKQGISISHTTVSRRLKKLREEGVYRIHADLDLTQLGKEIFTFYIEAPKIDQILTLEKVADNHPYTILRTRVLGKIRGVMFQFSIPSTQEAFNNLITLFNKLKEKKQLDSFIVDPDGLSCHTQSIINAWDGHNWFFDWKDFKQKIDNQSDKLTEEYHPSSAEITTNLKKLSLDDLKLLSEINRDAGQRNQEIKQRSNITGEWEAYQLSRRINQLKTKFVKGYRIFMKSQMFGIFDLVTFRCSTTPSKSIRLFNLLKEDPQSFVFQSTFTLLPKNRGFVWHIACPPAHFSPLANFLLDYCDQSDLYHSIYQSLQTYPLWEETFDEDAGKWRTDYKFMVEDVLRTISKNN